jgi:hypothetical protein
MHGGVLFYTCYRELESQLEEGAREVGEMHARMMQMKVEEAASARQVQERHAADETAAAAALRVVSDKLGESQQQVRCYQALACFLDPSRRVQVRNLEQSLGESTERLQQLQLHLRHVEEHAATYKLQTSEHIQRLQALHAEGLSLKQQEVCAAVLLPVILQQLCTA